MQAPTHADIVADTRKAARRYDAEARECETRGDYTRAEELFQAAATSEAEADRLEAAGPDAVATPALAALDPAEEAQASRLAGNRRARRRAAAQARAAR